MEIGQKIFSASCFCLDQIFGCGQCFRWERNVNGEYIGVAADRVLRINMQDDKICIENTTEKDFENIWRSYFDLDRDYSLIQAELSDGGIMDEAIACGHGIRILRQDPWETLISFILSSNNNISRIKGMIEKLCVAYGTPIQAFDSTFYTFPKPERLAGAEPADFAFLSAGYRDKYLADAINKVISGEVNLQELQCADYQTLRSQLMQINGIGPKVADCVALFGFGKMEAFPVDVWMRRVVETLYRKKYSPLQTAKFVEEKFGKYAGIAQQYLFYYIRSRNNRQEDVYGKGKKL